MAAQEKLGPRLQKLNVGVNVQYDAFSGAQFLDVANDGRAPLFVCSFRMSPANVQQCVSPPI